MTSEGLAVSNLLKIIGKPRTKKPTRQEEDAEIQASNTLSHLYGQFADFSLDDESKKQHQEVLLSLLQYRLCDRDWIDSNPSAQLVSALIQLARIFFRDRELQDQFFEWNLVHEFAQFGEQAVHRYFSSSNPDEASYSTAVIRGFLSISQKLCNSENHIVKLAESGFHKTVLRLLTARDMVVVQATLQLLGLLVEQCSSARYDLCSTNALDQCLQLLKDSDILSQKLSASLLRILCSEVEAKESVKVYDGVPVIVGLLSTRNVRLQWHLAWTLAQLAEDEEVSTEMGQLGATPLILSELGDISENKNRNLDDWLTMLTGLTAVLAQLCHVDVNAQAIVQDNGVYVLCKTLLAQLDYPHWYKNRNYYLLQCSVFRVLRLLFSLERNRQFFKRLFPPDFFSKFIDIGHYVVELNAYDGLVQEFHRILETSGSDVQQSVELINQRRAPLSYIGSYAVLEQLGVGAFGCVYKVQKKSSGHSSASQSESQQFFALKEEVIVDWIQMEVHGRSLEELNMQRALQISGFNQCIDQ